MSDSVLRAAQGLDTDPLVELWELDTSTLKNVFGVGGTGSVYHWTPGVLDYRMEGILAETSGATTVVLDRQITLPNPALKYLLQVGRTPGVAAGFSAAIEIDSISVTVGITGLPVSAITLVTPMPQPATVGMGWLIESEGSVWFGGVEYKPAPIQITGIDWSGRGALPRPKLQVSNIGGLATALIVQFGDIVGAQVTRLQTFKSFLDGEATPDSSAAFEPDIFIVDRKSAQNKTYVEFELAAVLDQQGIRLPRRLVLRDHCSHTYRQYSLVGGAHFIMGSCPYSAARYYTYDGAATSPDLDVCGKHLSDCLLRFPNNARLPTRAFPGVAEVGG